jgi:leucyl aminopeptidase (aminopeptidase T)
MREAKKAWGTAHVALGDNRSLGGTVESPLHIDFILLRPTVWLDGREVVRDGKLLAGEA